MTNPKQKKTDLPAQVDEKSIGDFKKELEEVMEKLALAEKERDEYLNGWKRAKADFINLRKEFEQRTGELSNIIKIDFIQAMLPLLDALEELARNGIEGSKNIKELANEILKKESVKEIKTKKGEEFNPEIHEALEGEGNIIEEVIQKGYQHKGGELIRPTKVKVRK